MQYSSLCLLWLLVSLNAFLSLHKVAFSSCLILTVMSSDVFFLMLQVSMHNLALKAVHLSLLRVIVY